MEATINITGLDSVIAKIKELQDAGHNTEPLMQEMANHLYNVTQRSFQNEETPDGKAWSPIQFRKDDKSPDKILRDEGTTQDSLQAQADKDSATVGLNSTANGYPFPMVHQFGTNDGSIEARAFFPIDENHELYENIAKELEEIMEEYIEEVLK